MKIKVRVKKNFGEPLKLMSQRKKIFGELLRLKNINNVVQAYFYSNRKPFDLLDKVDKNKCPKGIRDGIKEKVQQQQKYVSENKIKIRSDFKQSIGFQIDLIDAAKRIKELIPVHNANSALEYDRAYAMENNCEGGLVVSKDPMYATNKIVHPHNARKAKMAKDEIYKLIGKFPMLLHDRKTDFLGNNEVWEDQPWINLVANMKPGQERLESFLKESEVLMEDATIKTIQSLCMNPGSSPFHNPRETKLSNHMMTEKQRFKNYKIRDKYIKVCHWKLTNKHKFSSVRLIEEYSQKSFFFLKEKYNNLHGGSWDISENDPELIALNDEINILSNRIKRLCKEEKPF